MIEFCTSENLQFVNTFVSQPLQEKVTFMEAGALPIEGISEDKYNMFDLLICEEPLRHQVVALRSHREAALATDHYLVVADFVVHRTT